MEIGTFQELMGRTYGARDRSRGVPATVAWMAEELGELARAARKGSPAEQLHELGDLLAWLASLADQLDLSLEEAAGRYAGGCPRCGAVPCGCEAYGAVETRPTGVDVSQQPSEGSVPVAEDAKVYRTTEITATSTESISQAIRHGVGRASRTLRNLDWFEVQEVRGTLEGDDVGEFQVTIKIGFRVEEDED